MGRSQRPVGVNPILIVKVNYGITEAKTFTRQRSQKKDSLEADGS